MSYIKLKDRIESYQKSSQQYLLNKVPVVLTINGRSFSKLTSLINKPFSENFSDAMISTTLKLCSEVEGAFFGYQFNDEIVIISKNDQNIDTMPWYENNAQKICSAGCSIATNHFNNVSSSVLNLMQDATFVGEIFTVPNFTEVINTLIYKQQQNFYIAVQSACLYNLLKKYNKNTIMEMLAGLSLDEKIDILYHECGVDFDKYPITFRRGVGVYRSPKIIDGFVDNKWTINTDLPVFSKEPSFLNNLIKNL